MSISVIDNPAPDLQNDPHYEDRANLAASFRMAARLKMDEGVGNHFSYAVSDDGKQFLMNPFGRHFSNMRASDLMLLDANPLEDIANSRRIHGVVAGGSWHVADELLAELE